MRYTVRETERDVKKPRLKTDIGILPFTYVDNPHKLTLCLKKFEISHCSEPHNNKGDQGNSKKCRRRERGEAATNYRGLAIQRVPGAPLICVCFFVSPGSVIICRLYKLTLWDQAHFTLKLRVKSLGCNVKKEKTLSRPPEVFFVSGTQTRCQRPSLQTLLHIVWG
jgi:hypothetical protein